MVLYFKSPFELRLYGLSSNSKIILDPIPEIINYYLHIISHRMVKVYFTYQFDKPIGQAISKHCNFLYEPNSKAFICGVNQYIAIISAKSGEIIQYLFKEGKNVPVRFLYVHAGRIYGGYEDGELLVWGLGTYELLSSFDLHKTTISSIAICEEESKLVSAGFDGNIMIWDLLSEECQTIKSAHPSMITQIQTASVLIKGKPTQVIMSVGKDGFFRVWDLTTCLCITALSCQVTQVYSLVFDSVRGVAYIGTNKEEIVTIQFTDSQDLKTLCRIRGVFKKKSFARCMDMFMEHSTLYIFNADKTIQLYKLLSGKELEARKKRLINRKKKTQGEVEEPEQAEIELKFIEEKVIPFKFYNGFVYEGKVYVNNGTNVYELGEDKEVTQGIGRTQQITLEYPFAVQRSPTSLNVYSSSTTSKLFSIPLKAEWCHLFSSGHLLVVQAQSIQIWNLLKNEQLYRLEEKWSGCWAKKNRCLLWRENELGVFQIGYDKAKNIKMKLIDTKRFEDKITQACFKSSMDKYVVNLQNNQILINYSDTHKNFLKLYGHKLPILSFDIASDDSIIATGSVDKDIRLWDMDFGHSIKSIFAHQEAVTVVKFVPETHYLLSGSKDGHIKFWDMDTYQLIMDLEQSTMEIKSLAVSQSGDMIMAGGVDEGFRIWKQTNDQTIAADMEEKQMEKVMIEDYTKEKLDQQQEKTRYEDLKHGEQIIEALENKETPKTIMKLIKKIPAGNLKSCLSFLHERHVRRLTQYIKFMIAGNYQQETCWRVVRELNRGTELGKTMRDIWKPVEKMIQLNTEILKTVLKQVQQENELK